ncbi:RNA polymerase sigma-70 factor (ECF subfamily) [Kordia periserrulae]|uniref:RNA polymerase sigma-70 factor (ECF subfamily) n=1 Tax=Kordia periserrulae TaxID=701523 RepID=A0A2T6BTR3_9FLAO|nr:sigma-70 family RNA polymerase sigma factor [Kordia periserrulae]PTX59454.1 RNA polymerase sigma-70 factor (ECF subfamily) [Kordia periserrulae]
MEKELETTVCEERIFESLYRKLSKSIHDFLYYKYGSNCNPNDTTQEAFLKLWKNCDTVSPAKAKSFLFTVANNMVLNHLKHEKVKLNYQKATTKTHTNVSPEFIMQEAEFLEKYNAVLANMKEEYRVAFLLSKAENKKHKEIAELLDVTVKVVEYRVHKAFTILKEQLEGFSIK